MYVLCPTSFKFSSVKTFTRFCPPPPPPIHSSSSDHISHACVYTVCRGWLTFESSKLLDLSKIISNFARSDIDDVGTFSEEFWRDYQKS